MTLITFKNAQRRLKNTLAIVAVSLTLGGAAFAQMPPDGQIQDGPPVPDINQAGGPMGNGNGGPWGGGGRRKWRQGMGQGMGQGQGPNVGGGGMNSRRAARHQKMMQRFDTNGDGQLDAGEKAQLQQFKEQRRAQRQAQGIGQGANGMEPGMGPNNMRQGMRRGGMRGGKRRWQQGGGQGFSQEHAFQPGAGLGPDGGPAGSDSFNMPPVSPSGVGQIQPFQGFPQENYR